MSYISSSAPLQLIHHSEMPLVKWNTQISVSCTAIGKPEPHFTWTFKNQTIQNDSMYTIENLSENQSDNIYRVTSKLKIKKSNIQNSGDYICTAQSDGKNIHRSMQVIVSAPPHVEDDTILRINATLGKEVHIKCPLTASPDVVYDWNRKGENYEIDDHGRVLVIKNITFDDERSVKCTAKTPYDKPLGINININIQSAPVFLNQIETNDINLKVGSNSQLSCAYRGYPPAKITWFETKNEAKTPLDSYSSIDEWFLENVQNAMTISCEVENIYGKISKSFDIKIYSPPTNYGKEVEHISRYVGESVDLKCTIDGFPYPEFSWRTSARIRYNNGISVSNEKSNIYVFDRVTEGNSGRYECTAINIHGKVHKQFILTVEKYE